VFYRKTKYNYKKNYNGDLLGTQCKKIYIGKKSIDLNRNLTFMVNHSGGARPKTLVGIFFPTN